MHDALLGIWKQEGSEPSNCYRTLHNHHRMTEVSGPNQVTMWELGILCSILLVMRKTQTERHSAGYLASCQGYEKQRLSNCHRPEGTKQA